MPLFAPLLAGAAALITGVILLIKRRADNLSAHTVNAIPGAVIPGSSAGTKKSILESANDAKNRMVPVKLGKDTWLVAADYIGPIGINEAANLAKSMGMELPSPALVDAIWRQADLKLPPLPRNNVISEAVFADQRAKINAQIAGRPFTLVAGCFKDVVNVNGHAEIYGWQVDAAHTTMVNGKPFYQGSIPLNRMVTPGEGLNIQPQSGARHDQPRSAVGFKDYSQGVRLCMKVSGVV